MKEFKAAARAADAPEDRILEFAVGADEFRAKIPTTARVAMFVASMTEDATTGDAVGAVFSLLKDVLQDDGYRRLRKLISAGVIDLETLTGGGEDNDSGIIDWIIEEAAVERPTQPSVASSSSPEPDGRRSTGRSRGAGSIPSSSPSPVS